MLPFAAPAMLSGALKHWKLAGLALLILALGVQTLRLGNAQDKAERFKAERNAARAELVAAVRAAWPAYAEMHLPGTGQWPPVRDGGTTSHIIDLAVDTVMSAYAGAAGPNAWFES